MHVCVQNPHCAASNLLYSRIANLAPICWQPSIDVWKDVPVFKMAQRMLKNDQYNVLSDMFANTGIEKIWGDPKIARFLLDQNPMLLGFKGIQEIAAKETLQPADVSKPGLGASGLSSSPLIDAGTLPCCTTDLTC